MGRSRKPFRALSATRVRIPLSPRNGNFSVFYLVLLPTVLPFFGDFKAVTQCSTSIQDMISTSTLISELHNTSLLYGIDALFKIPNGEIDVIGVYIQ